MFLWDDKMVKQPPYKRFSNPVPSSNDDAIVEQIPSTNFVALGTASKRRRLLRGDSLARAASSANVSRSLLARFEAGDCDGINYQSMFRVMREMCFSLYVEGIAHECPTHMEIAALIKSSRKRQNLSLRDLNDLSGILFSTIFSIENTSVNSDFSYTYAMKLISALGHESCVIQTDDMPSLHEDRVTWNFRQQSGHPMFKHPYLERLKL